MRTNNANQIRKDLQKILFQNQKHQFQNNQSLEIIDIPSVTLYKNFDEVYCYKNTNLGQGAHGIVKLCYNKKKGKSIHYAVKIFRSGDVEIISTIKKTFKINRQLNDLSCVIKAIDLFINVTKEEIHLVMELCQYPSLEKIIQQQTTLSITQQQSLIFELATAIDKIHERCVCHRDLKPDNILVKFTNDDAKIKIIDFGVSKKFITKTKNSTLSIEMWTRTGTVFYQAPEIFAGGGYNQKVDIWSIGIVVYQIFCGCLPFQCDLISDTIELICDSNYNVENTSKFDQLDPLQQDLLKRLLKKDPQKRLTSKEFILHPWLHQGKQLILENNNENIQLNNDKSQSLSTSEQLINLDQIDQNYLLSREPFCVSTVLNHTQNQIQMEESWNQLNNHIFFYSSSKQLNQEPEQISFQQQQQPNSVSQFHDIEGENQQENIQFQDDSIDLNTYQTVGSIILN